MNDTVHQVTPANEQQPISDHGAELEPKTVEEAAAVIQGDRETADEVNAEAEWASTVTSPEATAADITAAHEARPEPDRVTQLAEAHITGLAEVVQTKWAELEQHAQAWIAADQDAEAWADLRDYDPGEWSAKRMEHLERRRMLEQAGAQLQQQWGQIEQAAHKETKRRADKEAAVEQRRLERAVPNWSDDVARQVHDFLKAQGFSAEELDGIRDHRVVASVVRAMQQGGNIKPAQKRGIKLKSRMAAPPKPTQAERGAALAEAEIARRRIPPHSMEAGALRLSHMGLGLPQKPTTPANISPTVNGRDPSNEAAADRITRLHKRGPVRITKR